MLKNREVHDFVSDLPLKLFAAVFFFVGMSIAQRRIGEENHQPCTKNGQSGMHQLALLDRSAT